MLKLKIRPYLADLIARRVTNREVARLLGVTEAYLSRTLKLLEVEKDPPANTRKKQHELVATRKAHRQSLANQLPPARAAREANCSLRTIYRYRKNDA
jgi:DNA-binding CsgD family transcriptional regulator